MREQADVVGSGATPVSVAAPLPGARRDTILHADRVTCLRKSGPTTETIQSNVVVVSVCGLLMNVDFCIRIWQQGSLVGGEHGDPKPNVEEKERSARSPGPRRRWLSWAGGSRATIGLPMMEAGLVRSNFRFRRLKTTGGR